MGNRAELFEKNFFDLTKERQIRDHLEHLKRTQILVAGCSTRRNRPTGCVIRSVGWREHGSIWRFNGRWWLCPLIESTREKIQPCQGESQQLQKDQVAFYEAERHCMSGAPIAECLRQSVPALTGGSCAKHTGQVESRRRASSIPRGCRADAS